MQASQLVIVIKIHMVLQDIVLTYCTINHLLVPKAKTRNKAFVDYDYDYDVFGLKLSCEY